MTSTALAKTDNKQLQHKSPTGELTVQDLIDRKRKILDVMKAVMVEGEHYGKIPGCGDKPTCSRPGPRCSPPRSGSRRDSRSSRPIFPAATARSASPASSSASAPSG
jgi:hypothetical protein